MSKIQAEQFFPILGLEPTILRFVCRCNIDGSTLIKDVLLKIHVYTERDKNAFTLGVICMKYVLFVCMNLCLKFKICISAHILIYFFEKRSCVCHMLMSKAIVITEGKFKPIK